MTSRFSTSLWKMLRDERRLRLSLSLSLQAHGAYPQQVLGSGFLPMQKNWTRILGQWLQSSPSPYAPHWALLQCVLSADRASWLAHANPQLLMWESVFPTQFSVNAHIHCTSIASSHNIWYGRTHSFPRSAEFWAKPRNLGICAEIVQLLVLGLDTSFIRQTLVAPVPAACQQSN